MDHSCYTDVSGSSYVDISGIRSETVHLSSCVFAIILDIKLFFRMYFAYILFVFQMFRALYRSKSAITMGV